MGKSDIVNFGEGTFSFKSFTKPKQYHKQNFITQIGHIFKLRKNKTKTVLPKLFESVSDSSSGHNEK